MVEETLVALESELKGRAWAVLLEGKSLANDQRAERILRVLLAGAARHIHRMK